MEVNDNIYPINYQISTDDIDYTKNFGELTLNEKIDNTIVYSSSNSEYSDLENKVIFSWYYTNKGKFKIIENCGTYNYQSVILTYQKAGGIFSYATSNQSYSTIYNQRYGYDAETLNNYYNNNYLVRGFKYYSLCACIYVEYFTDDGSRVTNITDLATFDSNYSNKKIKRVILTIYSNYNTSRTSTAIQFANYNEYVIPYFTLPNALDSTNYTISYENILNYFPRFNASDNDKTRGITILARGDGSSSYLTSAITIPQIKGVCYNRSNYKNINWENVSDVTYNEIANTTFMPDLAYNKNDILAMAATYGIMFTDTESIAKSLDLTNSENLTNENLYFPVQENNGLWQGRYTHGNDNTTNKIVADDWNNDKNAPFINGTPAVEDIDNRNFGDDNDRNMFATSQIFTHRYIVNATQLRQLSDYLNNSDKNLLNNIIQNLKLTGDNPLNSIVSIMSIPFLPVGTGSPQPIILGDNLINVGSEENKIALTSVGTLNIDTFSINLGSADIKQEFKNFLDFSPYTQYYAYIPFCNIVELDTDVIMNKTVSFQLNCDTLSGTCECEIRINGNLYKIVSGNFAYPIMVSGVDNAEYTSKMLSTLGKYVSGVGAMVASTVGIATGGLGVPVAAAGLVAGASTTFSSLYEFNTTPRNFESTGTSSGGLTHILPDRVCIYRYSVSDLSDVNYGHFVGYACEFSEKVGNLSGYNVFANVEIKTTANNIEKEKIKSLLESGVYI